MSEATPSAEDLFPYEPRPHQIKLAGAVERTVRDGGHLVVESPTGTGKTVCALAGVLAPAIERDLRVLYLTRTNAQQRQVLLELREINAAIEEQAESLRVRFGLPEGHYRFFGDQNGVRLIKDTAPAVEAETDTAIEEASTEAQSQKDEGDSP